MRCAYLERFGSLARIDVPEQRFPRVELELGRTRASTRVQRFREPPKFLQPFGVLAPSKVLEMAKGFPRRTVDLAVRALYINLVTVADRLNEGVRGVAYWTLSSCDRRRGRIGHFLHGEPATDNSCVAFQT